MDEDKIVDVEKQIDGIWDDIIKPFMEENPYILNDIDKYSKNKLAGFIYEHLEKPKPVLVDKNKTLRGKNRKC